MTYGLFIDNNDSLNTDTTDFRQTPFETLNSKEKAYKRAWELQLLYIEEIRIRRLCFQSKAICSTYEGQYQLISDYFDRKGYTIPRIRIKKIADRKIQIIDQVTTKDLNLMALYGTPRKRGRPPKASGLPVVNRCPLEEDTSSEEEDTSELITRNSRIVRKKRISNTFNGVKLRSTPKIVSLTEIKNYVPQRVFRRY